MKNGQWISKGEINMVQKYLIIFSILSNLRNTNENFSEASSHTRVAKIKETTDILLRMCDKGKLHSLSVRLKTRETTK